MELLARMWSEDFDTNVTVVEAFAAELDPNKRAFLRRNFPSMRKLFDDVQLLTNTTAYNHVTGGPDPVPGCTMFACGFSCKSRSKLNPHSQTFIDCCQRGEGETRRTWDATFRYVKKAKPFWLLLENVKELDSTTSDMSDAAFILDEICAVGYSARWMLLEAQRFGSRCRRSRLYLVGVLCVPPNNQDEMNLALAEMESLMTSCYMEPYPFDMFIITNPEDIIDSTAVVDASLWVDQIAHSDADLKFTVEHKALYTDVGFTYPPVIDELPAALRKALPSMTRRQGEIVIFMDRKYTPDNTPGTRRFIDTTPVLSRLHKRGWCVDNIPTLTGSMRLFMRCKHPCGRWEYRYIRGVELMHLMGWSPSFFRSIACEDESVLLSLAGNAYSGFAVMAALVCLFAVSAKFAMKAPEPLVDVSDFRLRCGIRG